MDIDEEGNPTIEAYERSLEYELPSNIKKKCRVQTTSIEQMYLIDSEKPGKVIFYFHGGGYWDQPMPFHYSFLRKLVSKTGGKAYIPVYPKAPSFGINEAHAYIAKGYEEVKEKEGEKNVVFMGDSAGGGFALAFALTLKEKGKEIPPVILLFLG